MRSIIVPKKPNDQSWNYCGPADPEISMGFECHVWSHVSRGFLVLSAVEVAKDPDDIDKGPEYHISMSKHGGRCTRNEARYITKAFGMSDATEDNHVPGGIVRNYWMPVNENIVGHQCPCVDNEPAMVEDKGDYIWRGVTR